MSKAAATPEAPLPPPPPSLRALPLDLPGVFICLLLSLLPSASPRPPCTGRSPFAPQPTSYPPARAVCTVAPSPSGLCWVPGTQIRGRDSRTCLQLQRSRPSMPALSGHALRGSVLPAPRHTPAVMVSPESRVHLWQTVPCLRGHLRLGCILTLSPLPLSLALSLSCPSLRCPSQGCSCCEGAGWVEPGGACSPGPDGRPIDHLEYSAVRF